MDNLTQANSVPTEFEEFRDFLVAATGIHLSDNKAYLVSTRLKRIMAEHQLAGLHDLVQALKRSGNFSGLRQQVIDAMTTNETFWFRDGYPFDYLKTHLLPALQKAPNRHEPIRIWCAACSTGQEPYSLSIAVEEYRMKNMGVLGRPVDIVATDLAPSVVAQAAEGRYDKLSVGRGLSQERLHNFFTPDVTAENWLVRQEIKRRIQFKTMNLLDSYLALGKFDIVFCRNVLIYFTADLKQQILRRMHQVLRPEGVLFLGSSEGVSELGDLYQMENCNPGILYRAKSAAKL